MLEISSGAELEHDVESPPERYHCRLFGTQLVQRPLGHLTAVKALRSQDWAVQVGGSWVECLSWRKGNVLRPVLRHTAVGV